MGGTDPNRGCSLAAVHQLLAEIIAVGVIHRRVGRATAVTVTAVGVGRREQRACGQPANDGRTSPTSAMPTPAMPAAAVPAAAVPAASVEAAAMEAAAMEAAAMESPSTAAVAAAAAGSAVARSDPARNTAVRPAVILLVKLVRIGELHHRPCSPTNAVMTERVPIEGDRSGTWAIKSARDTGSRRVGKGHSPSRPSYGRAWADRTLSLEADGSTRQDAFLAQSLPRPVGAREDHKHNEKPVEQFTRNFNHCTTPRPHASREREMKPS